MPRKRRVRQVSSSPERGVLTLADDDDEEQGTADLTLQILAKAEKRKRGEGLDGAQGIALDSDEPAPERSGGLEEGELYVAEGAPAAAEVTSMGRKKRRKKKRMKEKSAKAANMEDAKAEADDSVAVKFPDPEESLAMRKLLRGPRYFDPPEEQGDTCYSCSQQGHRAADCTEKPRQKPCYVCGDFGHDGYDCSEKTECFECGKSGHVARNCPNKQYKRRKSTGLCLLCGRLGHDTSACSGEYDPDDLKQVQCYVCKRHGHLCCLEVEDAIPTPVSCYQCGDLGHSGVGCDRQNGDKGDKTACYRCGQEGHFARECDRTNRDYNIKQRRHSWPAPWSADTGRYGDQELSFTPACQSRPVPFKKRLEQASIGKPTAESRKGLKRKRKEVEDDRWAPKSAGSHWRRSRD